jgi:flagellar biosynthesis/type III secretory pathway protein FliH
MAAEEAYKNGYENGYEEAINAFTEELKEKMFQMCLNEDANIPYPFTFVDKIADMLLKENKE